MNPDGARRFLIAAAVAHHRYEPGWDRPGLIDARQEIIDLFTGSLGYTHVSDLGLDPTQDQLTTYLRSFCIAPERRPEDMLAVYLTCHGEILDSSGDHVLLTGDTKPGDIADALPTAWLARKMLLDTQVRRVLLILDTCFSGRGGHEFAADALSKLTRPWHNDTGCSLVVINSAQPAEQAQTGAFPRLLREAVNDLSNAGLAPETLPLVSVINSMNANEARPGFQTISSSFSHVTGELPPFLLNPRHDPQMTEGDLVIRQVREWDAQEARGDVDRTQLLDRAKGSQDPSQGWWFSGRRAALTDITSWLGNPDPARRLCAVTAGPGSGKSAVLGLIASLTDQKRRRLVALDTLGLPPAAIPSVGSVDVTIRAQGLTKDQVWQRVAAVVRPKENTPEGLMKELAGREKPLTVLIDGLDEAADPNELTRQLLRPWAEHEPDHIRLLVGTRPHLLEHLGLRREDCIDLDTPRFADLDALASYAARGLVDSHPDSPYRDQRHQVQAVARAIAEAAEPSFLVARITSSSLASDRAIPDADDPVWRQSLPRLPGAAMQQDLDAHLEQHADRARDLLRPLAFAEGQGLPWEDIWAAVASGIAGKPHADQDLFWLLQTAGGSYVVEVPDAGRSAYRLYHQALAEHLRVGTDDRAVHQVFVRVLLSRVPVTSDGTRDWSRAHPYTLQHLATHAARCGQLDRMIADAGYLAYADPDELLPALRNVTTDEGRLTRSIYRLSADVHRRQNIMDRRFILAVDAARLNSPSEQQRVLAQPLRFAPRWASQQQTGTEPTATGHQGWVRAVTCTQVDGHPVIVGACVDGAVRVWDLRTGELRDTLTGHEGWVAAVACAEVDGCPVAVTGGVDGTVRLWDLRTGGLRDTLTGHEGWVAAVACAEVDGCPVAVTGGSDGTVRVWDLRTGVQRSTVTGHQGWVRAVACAEVDRCPVAVTGGVDGVVRVWDLRTGGLRDTLTGHQGWVRTVACTQVDGCPVAVTGGVDGTVRLWDLRTGEPRALLTGHLKSVVAMACTELDGRSMIVTSGDDATVRIWDTVKTTQVVVLTYPGGMTGALCIGPAREIITGIERDLVVTDWGSIES